MAIRPLPAPAHPHAGVIDRPTRATRARAAGHAGRTVSHLVAALAAGSLLVGGAVVGIDGGAPASAAEQSASITASSPDRAGYLSAKAGDLVDVRIGDVHPTQPSLGYDEVYYKLGRYTQGKDEARGKLNKKFDDWCEANGQGEGAAASAGARLDDPTSFTCTIALGAETAESTAAMKTVVIGPGGSLYLTDGHHTLTSFSELAADGGMNIHLRLKVLGNLSDKTPAEFWNTMKANKWTWLQDSNGRPIEPKMLPTTVGLRSFENDEYRSLLYFGRDIGYTAGTIPFQEFYWGQWLRDGDFGVRGEAGSLTGWDADADTALATVKAMTEKQVGLADTEAMPGGFTAKELGRLDEWNAGKKATKGDFGDLSVPYSDTKPGKIAYMLQQRAALTAQGVDPDHAATLVDQTKTTGSLTIAAADGAAGAGAGAGVGVGVGTATAADAVAGFAPGAAVTITGAGFATNSPLALELHSEPAVLGTVVTDDAGRFTAQVILPQGLAAGEHELQAWLRGLDSTAVDSGLVGSAKLTVSGPSPDENGSTDTPPSTDDTKNAGLTEQEPAQQTSSGQITLAETGASTALVQPLALFGSLTLLGGAVAVLAARALRRGER
ncbi:ParB/Srx family N-terminal domain-containing protein [Pseudoclavibacter sp. 13-3]|uniref:ParB/Srx family N-terminal domain-containing protein n=1 Tax=Pseudoclavibacter sp. 13-3 TaxID=2901228 RepID=UPI001E36687C|nr:ParB/Srx family N-terminal domain-containing protein [Pseudoclavibacter sp. 13-3]MCD7101084.1 ParB/Srx family N-terminal domain-containing protein [Pseudoclavibacter sp. 13-3]